MRSKFFPFVLFMILFVLFVATTAFAQDNIGVIVNGEQIHFDNQNPVIIDGRTLVPARGVFEALGFVVTWNAHNREVVLDNPIDATRIILWIDNTQMSVSGQRADLDVAPQIVNGSTMIPVRAVADAVGANVSWDADSRIVRIDHNVTRDYTRVTFNNLLRAGYSFDEARDIFADTIFELINQWRAENGVSPAFVRDPLFGGTSQGMAADDALIWQGFRDGTVSEDALNRHLFGHSDTITGHAWSRDYPLRSSIHNGNLNRINSSTTPWSAANLWLH